VTQFLSGEGHHFIFTIAQYELSWYATGSNILSSYEREVTLSNIFATIVSTQTKESSLETFLLGFVVLTENQCHCLIVY